MIRDINAGRFAKNTSLVLVTHGLAARVFLMRWFHWTVDQVGLGKLLQGLGFVVLLHTAQHVHAQPAVGHTGVSTSSVAHQCLQDS